MSVEKTEFGKAPGGETINLYTLHGGDGLLVKIMNFGGRITEIHARDRTGQLANINLGHDHFDSYLQPGEPYFGALIGRVANRIAGGEFDLGGKHYTLPRNNGRNTLHGGSVGFDKLPWTAKISSLSDGNDALSLNLKSPDGDQGFPGNVSVTCLYSTSARRPELRIDYTATTDAPTPINLTNHAYFNLAGAGSGTVLDHTMQIDAGDYVVPDAELIPTGKVGSVRGTPLDFSQPTRIGDRIDAVHAAPPGGYDHCYVLNSIDPLKPVARVVEPIGGRALEVLTDQPAIQFYSGNFLDGSIRGLGGVYVKHGAFCLETQHYPDAVHHRNFPSTILRPGETFRSWTIYRFGVQR